MSTLPFGIMHKFRNLFLPFFLPLLLVVPPLVTSGAAAETLVVKVTGFRGTAGNLEVMIWKDAAGFPTDPEKALARRVVAVQGVRGEVTFSGLARGVYAVAAFQDVNGNGKLDRSLLGWPVEPVGASNGATGLVGPPKFRDAAFELKQANQVIDLVLK